MAEKIGGLIGALIVSIFVLGLAHSISSGFAGFWGGLPFWIISVPILAMVFYDYWNSSFRNK